MQYIIRRRIGQAQSLLLNTGYSVTQIAAMVGYNNLNHFHCAFAKIVGMAPGRYRRSWSGQ
jgi:AraC-like DNA-binding protein